MKTFRKQGLVPKQFRVQVVKIPGEILASASPVKVAESAGEESAAGSKAGVLDEEAISRLATGLWRIRERMIDPKSGEALPEMRKVLRHVERMVEEFRDAGIEIGDHTGQFLPEIGASSIKVLAYEPREGLSRETVIETVKPSIYLRGRLIQMGEVIVGRPESGV